MAHFQQAAFPARAGRPAPERSNKYGAKCVTCTVWVEPEEGLLSKQDGKWVVTHKVCPEAQPEAPTDLDALPVAEGRYTIEFPDGSYRTLRVERQDEDANFKPGVGLVQYLTGSDNDSDYTTFGEFDPKGGLKVWKRFNDREDLREAVKVLIGSPDAARLAYAIKSERCSRCGRTLTVPASLHQGVGPECAKKMGF